MLDAMASAPPPPSGLSPAELRARANDSMVQGLLALGTPVQIREFRGWLSEGPGAED